MANINTYYSDIEQERMMAVAQAEFPDDKKKMKTLIKTGVMMIVWKLEEKHGIPHPKETPQ